MFEELLNLAEESLRKSGNAYDYAAVMNLTANIVMKEMDNNEEDELNLILSQHDEFIKNNRERWKDGFAKLHLLRSICLQVGMNFQQRFLKIPKYETDEVLGVLMRQHAHACRVSAEIIHLLEGGYPDAALARWRTLYEIAITCLIIRKCGRPAAIDYIKYNEVKKAEAVAEHRKTAGMMGKKTFSDQEAVFYQNIKSEITNGNEGWHWARKHTGYGKIAKLAEFAGLGKWSHHYMIASNIIHPESHEMASLYAMKEAKHPALLCGQSNGGLTEPAHFTAISLSQVTSAFVSVYADEDANEIDYTDSALFLMLVDSYVDKVGEAFRRCENLTCSGR